jgi:hypothetical protein
MAQLAKRIADAAPAVRKKCLTEPQTCSRKLLPVFSLLFTVLYVRRCLLGGGIAHAALSPRLRPESHHFPSAFPFKTNTIMPTITQHCAKLRRSINSFQLQRKPVGHHFQASKPILG